MASNDAPLVLGPIAFQGFEVPEHVTVGGRQRLVVHRMPGGKRVVDALGPDDAELVWSGTLSGPDAAERFRLLDTLRRAGEPLPLAWDAFAYSVIISNLEADTASPWWIPYRIACTVLRDSTALPLAFDLVGAVLDDLSLAAGYAGSGGVPMGGGPPVDLDAAMDAAASGLASAELRDVIEAGERLAGLSAARGYAFRAGRAA